MSDEEATDRPLNFVLDWNSEGQERRIEGPEVEVARPPGEAVEPPLGEAVVEEPVLQVEGPEFFEWTAERERAIQRLLEEGPEGTLPTVHLQLVAIHQALKLGELEPHQAVALLDEVDGYLGRRIGAEERKASVADAGFLSARAEKLKAFYAYLEASGSLREFVSGGEAVHLDVAAYAADQGTAFLAGARQMLFEVEPPEEEL